MRSRLLPILALGAVLLCVPQVALAHAALVSATPGPGDEVVGAPAEVVATFSQDLDLSRTSMEVRDATGATVAEGPVLGDGPRQLRLSLPTLAPGVYQVRWTSFSAEDGELERGTYTFTILPRPSPLASPATAAPTIAASPAPTSQPTGAPTPEATPPATPSADGGLGAMIPIGLAAIALLAIGAWLLRRGGARP